MACQFEHDLLKCGFSRSQLWEIAETRLVIHIAYATICGL